MSEPQPLAATLTGACPKCGQHSVFAGWVSFAPRCPSCGLDFDRFNVGDGPAAFLILIVGAIVTIAAVMFELAAEPPFLVHLVWLPVATALTLVGLRLGKGWLLGQEYRHRAREGRLAE